MNPPAWAAFALAAAAGAVARLLVGEAIATRVTGLRGPNAATGLRGPNAATGLRGPNAATGLRGPNAVTGLPWGTIVVNVSGSLLSGFLTGLALYHGFPATPRVVLVTGFCGAYTTFSTFTFETIRLIEDGALGDAARNVGITLAAALAAAAAGLALATR